MDLNRILLKLATPDYLSKALVSSNPNLSRNFVIYGMGRSGSTLLCKLLTQHPKICCESAFLNAPTTHSFKKIKLRSLLLSKRYFGFSLRPWELERNQKIQRKTWLEAFHEKGGRVVFLYRENSARAALSAMVAEQVEKYHHYEKAAKNQTAIDIERLRFKTEWREEELHKDFDTLKTIPHLRLVYEENLSNEEKIKSCLNQCCDFLGVERMENIAIPMQALGLSYYQKTVSNFEEVATLL